MIKLIPPNGIRSSNESTETNAVWTILASEIIVIARTPMIIGLKKVNWGAPIV